MNNSKILHLPDILSLCFYIITTIGIKYFFILDIFKFYMEVHESFHINHYAGAPTQKRMKLVVAGFHACIGYFHNKLAGAETCHYNAIVSYHIKFHINKKALNSRIISQEFKAF